MKETVIARDAAESIYFSICEYFDGEAASDTDKDNIIGAIMQGRIDLDEAKGELKYTLLSPIVSDDGKPLLETVTLHEPTMSDVEYINKGFHINGKDSGDYAVDMSEVYSKICRMVIKLDGVATGIAERIKKRDITYLNSLSCFFG